MRKKTKLFLVTIVSIAAISFVISSCAPAVSPTTTKETTQAETTSTEEKAVAEQFTLRVWKGPHTADDPGAFADVIKKFEEANPNIKIEYTPTPWDTFQEKYGTAFASGNPPDVFYGFAGGYIDGFLDKILPLEDIASADEIKTMAMNVPEGALTESLYEGKHLGIPWIGSNEALLYNIDMLEAAGYDKAPDTLDQALEYAKKMTLSSGGKIMQYGYGQLSYDTAEGKPEFYLNQFGASLFNSDLTGIGFDNPEGKAAFEYIDKMWNIEKAAVPPGLYPGTTMLDAFFSGKFAMWHGYSQMLTEAKKFPDFKLGVALIPAGPETSKTPRAAYIGTGWWSIAKDSKHQKEALEFIKMLYDPSNSEGIITKLSMVPINNDLAKKMYGSDPLMLVFIEQMKYAVPYVLNPKLNEVKTAVWDAMQALQTGQIGPDEAWKQAVERGEAALGE
ncbi:MAG: extracellular solute-binding protein [Actinobacteria bacterium]|nr:extracellular solute-binding protein [Actinomycetota bacterium]